MKVTPLCCTEAVHKTHTDLDDICCCGTVTVQKFKPEEPMRHGWKMPTRRYMRVRKSALGLHDWIVLEKDGTGTRVVARFDEYGCALRFAINYAKWGGPRV